MATYEKERASIRRFQFKIGTEGKGLAIQEWKGGDKYESFDYEKQGFQGYLDGIEHRTYLYKGKEEDAFRVVFKDEKNGDNGFSFDFTCTILGISILNYITDMPWGAFTKVEFWLSKEGYPKCSVYEGGERAEWTYDFKTANGLKEKGRMGAWIKKVASDLSKGKEEFQASNPQPKTTNSLNAKDFGSNTEFPSMEEIFGDKTAKEPQKDDDEFEDLPF